MRHNYQAHEEQLDHDQQGISKVANVRPDSPISGAVALAGHVYMCYAEITLDGGDSRYDFTRSWTEPYRAKLMESAMKCFTLISAGPGQDRKQFQQWFLREHAPLVLEHVKGAQRYIVNLADVVPPPVENMVGLAPETTPPYDVITELWMGSARDFRDPARLYGSAAAADAVHKHLASRARAEYSYRVTEIIEKDVQPIRVGERSPGLKSVIPLEGRPGQSEDDWRNGWQVHSKIALRTHVGMSKYVRNLVEEILTQGAPEYLAIAELHYPAADDMRFGLFPTPHAMEVIAYDISRWGGPVSQHYSSEWPLKL